MKMKWTDRFLLFICALLMILAGAATILLTFFARVESGIFTEQIWRIIGFAAGGLCVLTGIYLFSFLHRSRRRNRKFIKVRGEGDEMRLAVEAVEDQVKKCTDMHQEMHLEDVKVLNDKREGVTILVKVSMAGNVSIPLAVASLQKQVRQYLLASSGISVKEVKVAVDTMRSDISVESPYRLSGQDKKDEEIPQEEPAPAAGQQEEPAEEPAEEPVREPVTYEVPQEPAKPFASVWYPAPTQRSAAYPDAVEDGESVPVYGASAEENTVYGQGVQDEGTGTEQSEEV
ncbi:MAG: hypothetical protein CW338_03445 [Clostridiales bacterium]|nr:hypothetical protein [Clostridiales bacterium]